MSQEPKTSEKKHCQEVGHGSQENDLTKNTLSSDGQVPTHRLMGVWNCFYIIKIPSVRSN